MDARQVRSVKLRLAHGHVRAVVEGGGAERGADLEAEPARRVFAAAAGLVAAVEAGAAGANVRSISLDLARRVARVSLAGDGPARGMRIDGAAFDALPGLAPLVAALLAELDAAG